MANVEEGFRRVAKLVGLVLAVPLLALAVFCFFGEDSGPLGWIALIGGGGVYLATWVACHAVLWVARGFSGKQPAAQLVVTADEEIADFARESLDEAVRASRATALVVPSISRRPLSLYEAVDRLVVLWPRNFIGYAIPEWMPVEERRVIFDRAVHEIKESLATADPRGQAKASFIAWCGQNLRFSHKSGGSPEDWEACDTVESQAERLDELADAEWSSWPRWKVWPIPGIAFEVLPHGEYSCDRCGASLGDTIISTHTATLCLRHARHLPRRRKVGLSSLATFLTSCTLLGFGVAVYLGARLVQYFARN